MNTEDLKSELNRLKFKIIDEIKEALGGRDIIFRTPVDIQMPGIEETYHLRGVRQGKDTLQTNMRFLKNGKEEDIDMSIPLFYLTADSLVEVLRKVDKDNIKEEDK